MTRSPTRRRLLLPLVCLGLAAALGRVEGEGDPEPPQVEDALSRTLARAVEVGRRAVVRIRPGGEVARGRSRSGVIVGPGLVATCATNVAAFGLDDLVVETADGRTYPASLRGRDLRLRIVLLAAPGLEGAGQAGRLVAPGPQPAGTLVLALGATLDPGGTATFGILSAGGRFGGRADQTDAPIDASNVGGALVDIEGRLVGVLVHVDERLGQRSGVGFAVPLARIEAVLEPLKEGRELAPGWLGLVVPRYDRDQAGVRVEGAVPGGPAAAAGIRAGDQIVALAGRPTPDQAAFRDVLCDLYAGQEIGVDLLRDGERRRVRLKVAQAD